MADQEMPQKLGRYMIVRELGKGAMGVVYEGNDPNIGRRVAIKTARRDVMASSGMADEMMERFLREARAAGALNHPNIITIYDAGEENGIAYIAMEFLEGGDLRDLLDERRRLDIPEIVEIGADICEALAEAHSKGIIHRDIKPANIMIPKSGPLKLADFGIAHVNDSTLTQDGALIGTPHYMSPEQFMGQKLDGRSDLFSVGVILYEMLTGEKPFTGEALSTVMHHVIRTQPAPPSELNFNVPDAVSGVVMKAMSKRPAERYADGRAMGAALRESLKPNPNPAILAGTDNAAEKTTISAAGISTMVMQGPPPSETTASASTTQTPAPGHTETSTVMSAGPPPGASDGVTPAPPGTAKKPLSKPLLGGITAAVLVVLIGGGVFLSRSGEPSRPPQTPPSVSETEPAAATLEKPAKAAFYGSIMFTVWQAKTMEVYKNYEDFQNLRQIRDGIDQVAGPISVEVRDGQGKVAAQSATYTPGEVLPLSNQPTSVAWTIDANGVKSIGELPPSMEASQPNEALGRTVVLPPKS